MNDIEFNLIDEPWIRVIDNDCRLNEVSLRDVIVNAHKYKSLKGELPTQDVSVMRLILAVLHTVFSRADQDGNDDILEEDEDEALERWKNIWDKGCFSETAIDDYFSKWHERFWLFHPERPFGQVAALKYGTVYYASKLNGEISESNNKIRFFSSFSGDEKGKLSYSQSARWLLYLNSYDDTSSKPSKEGKYKAGGKLPSSGAGWLGQLGLINIKGDNLFETLMLNLVMINMDKVQTDQHPVWERDVVSDAERTEIAIPSNLAELYTIQSRRILLKRERDKVVSLILLGGDFFEKENAFFEPMTVWRKPKTDKEPYVPKRHDSSRQMWREFSALYNYDKFCAGVLRWFRNCLYGEGLISRSYMLKTDIVSVEYGDKDFFVKNVFSDSLVLHSAILSELGANWRKDIEIEIQKCDKIVYAIADFAADLYVASGGLKNDTGVVKANARSQIYYRLDVPFRKWLMNIDPDYSDRSEQIEIWRNTVSKISNKYVYEIAEKSSESAFVGHMVKDDKNNELYSVSKALNIFKYQLRKIYEKGGDK